MTISGREIPNPVLRGIVALIGTVIAMIVAGGVVFILLPMVGARARRAMLAQAEPRL